MVDTDNPQAPTDNSQPTTPQPDEKYMQELLSTIQKEIAEEDTKRREEVIVKDKSLLKTVVKQMEEQKKQLETSYSQQLEAQKKQLDELNLKLSKISEGSKTATVPEQNPFRAPTQNPQDRMKLIKEDLIRRNILYPDALQR